MANKVTPATGKSTSDGSSSPMLDLMKTYVKSKFSYNAKPLTNAKVTNVQQEHYAYQIDIWTLMECRTKKKINQPYNNETIANEGNRNEWDFDFERPAIDAKTKKTEVRNLDQTRWTNICLKCSGFNRYACSSCKGDGGKPCYHCKIKALTDNGLGSKKPCKYCNDSGVIHCLKCKSTGLVECTSCKGCGKILHYYQLSVKWYTIHSVSYLTNTDLPPKIIHKAPDKKNISITDQKWSKTDSIEKYFQTAFASQQKNPPIKLEQLTEDFNKKHVTKAKKNCRIVQMKCEIQKLDVTEVEYEAEGFKNKHDPKMGDKFKFYYYGKGKKDQPMIYENDYPMNACGCCGVGCAHHSKLCTIS
ncbi:unnamed protein product [Adineta steineri]|uniref:Uncharacterized protein n=3 Tax=Adineta steineri TaxID=433720 RepID=A0A818GCD9_9BILA|nr:unnamed protein product [Adineta steineri]CAF3487640.1 unnamed protein product [Adineta steineri]